MAARRLARVHGAAAWILRVHALRGCIGVYVMLIFMVALRPFFSTYGEHPPHIPFSKLSDPPRQPPMLASSFVKEQYPPDPALYGMSTEKCFVLGDNGPPLWHMNSRALCSINAPLCLFGHHLQHLYTFTPRGSASCDVVNIRNIPTAEAFLRADKLGLNESCAALRERRVISMFGGAQFVEWESWVADLRRRRHARGHHPASWNSEFAIIVPKYQWSWNICHYNRIWNYISYVIRNLHTFAPYAPRNLSRVDVLFRSGLVYDANWPKGLREATLPVLEAETGYRIYVGKLRYHPGRDFQCIKRGVILGAEGRVDAFPFLNDSDIWTEEEQRTDTHWPTIPADSLWLRQAVFTTLRLPPAGIFDGPGIGTFRSVPVPPKRIALLERSVRSRRRLTRSGRLWFDTMINDLAGKYGFEIRLVRFSRDMSLREQIELVQDTGVAIGLHGANLVNTMFMPAGAAMFEIFPWRYVRFYYAAGANSGLRYSYHEPEAGIDRHCGFDKRCFMRYRESVIYLSDTDRDSIQRRIENAIKYLVRLHVLFPNGTIPLQKDGNVYRIPRR